MRKPVCPRCGGYIPNDRVPGAYPGALSRWDNKTEICSDCGSEEALIQWSALNRGADDKAAVHPVTGVTQWVQAP